MNYDYLDTIFIQKGYASYSNTLNATDAELDTYLNGLIDNENLKNLFKAFLQSRDANIGTNHDMAAPVIMWLLMKFYIYQMVSCCIYVFTYLRIYRVDDLELFHFNLTSSFSSSVIRSDSVSLP